MTDAESSSSPTLRRLAVAAALRRHRRSSGFTTAEVLDRLDFSASKLSRIETGTRPIQLKDLEQLCTLYRIDDDERAELVRWAAESRQSSTYRHVAGSSVPWVEFAELEQAARRIDDYKTSTITALLQTADYTRALVRTFRPNAPGDWIEEQVHIRQMRREQVVDSEASGAELTFVVDEASLRRVVGGTNTMRTQLAYLAALSEQDRVRFHAIPFNSGAHPGMDSLFTILSFGDAVRDRVYVDSLAGSTFFSSVADLERFRDSFTRILNVALDPAGTIDLIRDIHRSL
ncbi:helix-turn-helix transcriptional regulator [Cryptosporangium japonicum]|uniref:Helix-turn-helix transcriptional regulator n=1 Tax=Cryptosporangium japonicum TaxID=80872 RepID=A0ABP3EG64_9ACTN